MSGASRARRRGLRERLEGRPMSHLGSGTKMPKSADLAPSDVQAIVNWTCEGAPND